MVLLAMLAAATTYPVVDGQRYRVTKVDDRTVIVAKKATVVKATLDEKDAMRAAVLQATGCQLYDEQWTAAARLTGRLRCP